MSVSSTSRNGASFVPATIYTRIGKDHFAGWGVDVTRPGLRVFTGLRFSIQDQNLATVDAFQLTAYTESSTPHVPDTSTPLATTGYFVLPAGTGVGAFYMSANFSTAVTAPATADVFVGIGTPIGWNSGITDGLSIFCTVGDGSRPTRDQAGFAEPSTIQGSTYSGYYIPSTNTHGFATPRQSHIEPIFDSPAGVASALHYNNPNHPSANNSPGTTCMHSALNPDSRSPSRNPGRADDVGMRIIGVNPNNCLVFFLVDIAAMFGPEVPLASFLPGSQGAMCVNQTSMQVIALGFNVSNVITFSASARSFIAGLPLIQQAVALELTTNIGFASPCTKQTL